MTTVGAGSGGPFDSTGRVVPVAPERVYSTVSRGYFSLPQPPEDLARVHANAVAFLADGREERVGPLDAFRKRCEALRARLEADDHTRGLFAGVHVPFLAPGHGPADLGEAVEGVAEAAGRSFRATYPAYAFRNYLHGLLKGTVSVVAGTRYERVISAWRAGPVMGWYFPTALAGFAIPDQRTVVGRLHADVVLSGPLEVSAALVATPSMLMTTEKYPYLLALASVALPQKHMFPFWEAYGWNLTFNQRSMIGAVSEYYAGGLTVLA